MTKDRDRRLAQLLQAYENGILDEDTYRAAVAALGAGTRFEAKLDGTGAIAQQDGVAAGQGAIAVGRDVLGPIFHIYQTAPGQTGLSEAEFEAVLNDYLGWVLREHGRARLHGLQSLQGTGAINRRLSDVYVSLAARHQPAVTPGDPRLYSPVLSEEELEDRAAAILESLPRRLRRDPGTHPGPARCRYPGRLFAVVPALPLQKL